MTDLPPPIDPFQLRDALIYEPPDFIWSNGAWYRSKMDLLAGKSIPLVEVYRHFAERIFEAKRTDWPDMEWRVDQSEQGNLRAFLYPLGYKLGAPGFQNAVGPMHFTENNWVLSQQLESFVRFAETSLRKQWWEEHGKPWDQATFLTWLEEEWGRKWPRRRVNIAVQVDRIAPEGQHVLTWANEQAWADFLQTGYGEPARYEYELIIHPRDMMELQRALWAKEEEARRGAMEAGYPFFGRYVPMMNFKHKEGH